MAPADLAIPPVSGAPVRYAPANDLARWIMDQVGNPDMPIEKLRWVQERMDTLMAEQRRELFQADFIAMCARIGPVDRNGLVEVRGKSGQVSGRYKFVKYEDMEQILRPLEHDYHFARTFDSGPPDDKGVPLIGVLLHESGWSTTARLWLPPDHGHLRNPLQAMGSTITYGRRYLTDMLYNIVRKGTDDDGVSSGLAPVSPEQLAHLNALLSETATDRQTFLAMMVSCERLEDIPARDYPRLVNALEAKRAAQARRSS